MATIITFVAGEDVVEYNPSTENVQRIAAALNDIKVDGESTLDTWTRWFKNDVAKFVHRYEQRIASEAVPLDGNILE